ncbi:MAG TPA: hypothetical protein VL981_02100 [Candidatus Methylacidiphilales bacterium]|nr:hypothetical protein [Candidatus Methylacidiphilales bacterium]
MKVLQRLDQVCQWVARRFAAVKWVNWHDYRSLFPRDFINTAGQSASVHPFLISSSI